MNMQGIDISHWQSGLNLHNVACDFVIVKLTQGHTFVDPCAVGWIHQAQEIGKPWGVYHYVSGCGYEREANHFTKSASDYVGNGIIVLDWEAQQNSAWGDEGYLASLTEKVIELTGVAPLIYASKANFPWDIAKQYDCGAWVAQYANDKQTGYQDTPWNENAYDCVIRQYTSNGNLASWHGALDLDKAYITADQWAMYANPSHDAVNDFDTLAAAFAVVRGEYGNGTERKNRLGTHYKEVQEIVNRLYREANNAIKGKYGNGAARREALGDDYNAVQWIVNERLK